MPALSATDHRRPRAGTLRRGDRHGRRPRFAPGPGAASLYFASVGCTLSGERAAVRQLREGSLPSEPADPRRNRDSRREDGSAV